MLTLFTRHLRCNTCAGLSILVTHGQKICQKYFRTYQEDVPTVHVVSELASVMQEYTQRG
jgi:20S proteasome alpha/beta subunit